MVLECPSCLVFRACSAKGIHKCAQPTGTLRRRTVSLYNLGEHCVTHKYIKRTLRPQELFLCIHLNLSTAMQVGEVLIRTEVSFLVGWKPFNLCCSGDTPAVLRSQQLLLHSAEILLETVLSPWTNRNDSSSKNTCTFITLLLTQPGERSPRERWVLKHIWKHI